jgi:hypothetical protein
MVKGLTAKLIGDKGYLSKKLFEPELRLRNVVKVKQILR